MWIQGRRSICQGFVVVVVLYVVCLIVEVGFLKYVLCGISFEYGGCKKVDIGI